MNTLEYRCAFCWSVWPSQLDLTEHVRAHFASPTKRFFDQEHRCPSCPAVFLSSALFEEHARGHREGSIPHQAPPPPLPPGTTLDEQRRTCAHCGNQFTHRKNMVTHVRQFHDGVPCKICGKLFKPPRALRQHMAEHGPRERYTSATEEVRDVGAADEKEAEPSPVGEHRCALCERCFASTKSLKLHITRRHPPIAFVAEPVPETEPAPDS